MYPIYCVKGKYRTQDCNFYYNKRNLTDGLTLVIFEHGDKADLYFDWDDGFPGDKGLRDCLFPDQKRILDELEGIYKKYSVLRKGEYFGWSTITLRDISPVKAKETARDIRAVFSKRLSIVNSKQFSGDPQDARDF